MCDMSFKRKLFTVILLAQVSASPQLDLPPYRGSDGSTQDGQSVYNSDYDRSVPYNVDISRNVNQNLDDGRRDGRYYDTTRYGDNRYDDRAQYDDRNRYDDRDRNGDPNRFNPNRPPSGDVRGLLQALDVQASQHCSNNVASQWYFETNVNEVTQLEAVSFCSYIHLSAFRGHTVRNLHWPFYKLSYLKGPTLKISIAKEASNLHYRVAYDRRGELLI